MNEFAYPSPTDPKTGTLQKGMTLHDYVAVQSLQGMLSNPALFDANGEFQEDNIKVAFEIADVFMKNRRAS